MLYLTRYLLLTTLLWLAWLAMAGSLQLQEVLTGLVCAGVLGLLLAPHARLADDLKLSPALPLHLLRFLGYFLRALLTANLDMARRVLSPQLPINPAMVEVETRLQSDLGRLLLANSITLTPGTLTVDVLNDRLQVHWIDTAPGADLEHATRAIAAGFEQHLARFLR